MLPNPKLTIDLIPRGSFFRNLRSLVPIDEWRRIRAKIVMQSGGRCEICAAPGRLDCHEVWSYEGSRQILVDLIAICPDCHGVKHFGRSEVVGNGPKSIKHLMLVNAWTLRDAFEHVRDAYAIWNVRNLTAWTLDVAHLASITLDGISRPAVVSHEDLMPEMASAR